MNPSTVFFAAANAAEAALPPASKALIEHQDKLFREWQAAGGSQLLPVPPDLKAACAAVAADELANFAMECRTKGNEFVYRQWQKEEAQKEAA